MNVSRLVASVAGYAISVREDGVGRAALRRGPLMYCVEEADNPGGPVQLWRCLAQRRSTPNGGRTCLAAR
jgi:DUF1680 family protein